MNRPVGPLALVLVLLLALWCPIASASVNVERTGSENPGKEVASSTIWGGVAGATIGLAVALMTSSTHSDGDIVRYSFAAGTLLGFGFGVMHVMSRPQPTAMLELKDGVTALSLPTPAPAANGGVAVRLVAVRF